MPKRTFILAALFGLFDLSGFCPLAMGETEEEPQTSESMTESTEKSNLRILLSTVGMSLKRGVNSQSGVGGQGAVLVGLSEKYQLGIGVQEVVSVSPFSMLYTSVDLRLVYAITGSFSHEKKRVSLNSKDVVVSSDRNVGGLRFQAVVSENYLRLISSSTGSHLATGLGAGLFYEFPISQNNNLFIGGRYDVLPALGSVTHSFQGNIGIVWWP